MCDYVQKKKNRSSVIISFIIFEFIRFSEQFFVELILVYVIQTLFIISYQFHKFRFIQIDFEYKIRLFSANSNDDLFSAHVVLKLICGTS